MTKNSSPKNEQNHRHDSSDGFSEFAKLKKSHKAYNDQLVTVKEQLKSSEQLYRETQKAAKLGGWCYNLESDVLTMTDETFQIFELSVGTPLTIEDVFTKYIHEDDLALAKNVFFNCVEYGIEYSEEVRLTTANNNIIWAKINGCASIEKEQIVEVYGNVMDITERKLFELALAESESKFRAVFKESATIMLVINPKCGSIIDCNYAAEKFYGYSHNEFLKLSVFDLNCLPKHQVYEEFSKAQCQQKLYFNFTHKLANGKTKSVEVYSSPIFIDGQKRLLSIVHDITEKKKAEQALIESEKRYRSLFDSNRDALLVFDSNFIVQDANAAFEKLLGYKIADLKGQHASNIYYDLNHFQDLEQDLTGNFSQATYKKNIHYQCLHGDDFIGETIVFYLNEEQGKTNHFVAIIRDITEEIQKSIDLDISISKFKRLANATFEGICYIYQEKIFEINDQLCRMLGYSQQEMIGQPIFDFVFPGDHQIVEEKLLGGGDLDYEMRLIKKDDTLIHVEANGRYVEINNKRLRLSVVRDITYRKQAEQKLLKAIIDTEEKERKLFAEDLHDELGPHMSGIRLLAGSLSKKCHDPSVILEIANTLDNLVKEAIEKIRSISNRLTPSVLSDYGLEVALRTFCNRINQSEEIMISLEVDELSCTLSSNLEIVIYRVLIELINNTIKHAKADNITIVLTQTDYGINLEYQDDGIGFNLNEMLTLKKGLGLTNILNRIELLESSYSFVNKSPQGITYNIMFYTQSNRTNGEN